VSTGQGFSGGRGQPSSRIPESIDRYQVLRRLGGGAQGTVYLALDPLLDRKVAIKELVSTDHSREFTERFTLEARTLAKLNAPNIVQIYDFNPSWPYLVMEYCGDGDLNQLIKSCRPLPLARIIQLARQICRALVVAHENESPILHRDLKPANVLFQGEVPKVSDFGLAKVLGAESTGLTKTDIPMGTIGYCSPEQLDDAANVDHRTDLWAVGVILYELLNYHSPFEKDGDLVGTMKRVLLDPPSPPRYELPPGLWSFIERAVSKKREDRFASAREMIQVLDQVLGSVPEAEQLILPPESVLEDAERLASQVASSLGSGSTEDAKKWMDELRRVSPEHSLTRYWSRRLRDSGEEAVVSAPSAPSSDDLIARIEGHATRYEYDEARRLCGKALMQDPGNTRVQDLLQEVNKRERTLAESLREARAQAKSKMLEGDLGAVVAVWQGLDQQFPKNPDVNAELAAAAHAFGAERRRQRWEQTEQRALGLKQAGDLADAVSVLDGFLAEFPEDSRASDLRGVIQRELAHVAKLERVQQLRAEARSLQEAGKLERSRAQWLRILEEVPTDEEAHREAERVRREIAERARREQRVNARARASGLADAGDLRGAIAVWRAFLDEHPGDGDGTRELAALEQRAEQEEKKTLAAALERESRLVEARLSAGRYGGVASAQRTLQRALAEARAAAAAGLAPIREARTRLEDAREQAETELLSALDERRRRLRGLLSGAEDLLPAAGLDDDAAETTQALAAAVIGALGTLSRAFPPDGAGDPVAELESAERALGSAVEAEARGRREATETARERAAAAVGRARSAVDRVAAVEEETGRSFGGRLKELEEAAGSPSAERLAAVAVSAEALAHEAEAAGTAALWSASRELETLFENSLPHMRVEEPKLRELLAGAASALEGATGPAADPGRLVGSRDELRAELDACRARARDAVAASAERWKGVLASAQGLGLESDPLLEQGETALAAGRVADLDRRALQLEARVRQVSLERDWEARRAAVRRLEGPLDPDGVCIGPEDRDAQELLARYRTVLARGANGESSALAERLATLRPATAGEAEDEGPEVDEPGSRIRKFNERHHPGAVRRFDEAMEAWERARRKGDRAAAAQRLEDLRRAGSALIRPPSPWPRIVPVVVAVALLAVVAFLVMRPSPSRAEVTVVSPLGEVRIESLTRDGVPVEGIPADQRVITAAGVSWSLESGKYVMRTEHGVELAFEVPHVGALFVPAQPPEQTPELIRELGLDKLLENGQ